MLFRHSCSKRIALPEPDSNLRLVCRHQLKNKSDAIGRKRGCHYLQLTLISASIWLPRVLLECPDAKWFLRAEVTSTSHPPGALAVLGQAAEVALTSARNGHNLDCRGRCKRCEFEEPRDAGGAPRRGCLRNEIVCRAVSHRTGLLTVLIAALNVRHASGACWIEANRGPYNQGRFSEVPTPKQSEPNDVDSCNT